MSKEALQKAEERKAKGKGERERYIQQTAQFQRIIRRDKKAFLSGQCKKKKKKKNKRTIYWERLEKSSRKLKVSRKHFMQEGLDEG